jgi:hypothetical protein
MVVSVADPENEGPREQHNHGSGTFVGRDNYGDIRYEMLDLRTKTALAKLSKDAPDLAKLLRTALRDGVISPDIVAALESAVRNINEDVAESLMIAGRNINEDVAESLRLAGQNINEDVANKFSLTVEALTEVTRDFEYAVEKAKDLQGTNSQLIGIGGTVTGATSRIDGAVTSSSLGIIDIWKTRFKIFFWGVGIGLLAGAILTYYLIKR